MIAGAAERTLPTATAFGLAALVLAVAGALGAAAAGDPIIAIAILAGGVFLLTVTLRPDNASLLVVFLIYSNAAVVAVTHHGAPVLAAAVVPLLLGVPIAYAVLIRREPIVLTPGFPWIVGLLLVQMIGVILARDTNDAFSHLLAFLSEGVLLYLLVVNAVRTPEQIRQVVWVLLLVGTLLGALSAWQEVTDTASNDYWGFAQTESRFSTGEETLTGTVTQPRQAGPIGEKNRYAQVMLMLVPLGLLQFWSERRTILRAGALAAVSMAGVGTALTFSRGAAVGFALMLLIMALLRYIRISQIVLVGVGLAALLTVLPQYGARLMTLEAVASALEEDGSISGVDNSVVSRATTGLAALGVFADHPIAGVGPGQFSSFYREYAAEIGRSVRAQDREAHNLYLGIAAENGILGVICFGAIVGVTLYQLRRARQRWLATQPDLANLATGFMLALVTYLTTGLFLHLSYVRYFWLMMALAAAAAYVLNHLPAAQRSTARPD